MTNLGQLNQAEHPFEDVRTREVDMRASILGSLSLRANDGTDTMSATDLRDEAIMNYNAVYTENGLEVLEFHLDLQDLVQDNKITTVNSGFRVTPTNEMGQVPEA